MDIKNGRMKAEGISLKDIWENSTKLLDLEREKQKSCDCENCQCEDECQCEDCKCRCPKCQRN